jgi:phage anti-repressor protein
MENPEAYGLTVLSATDPTSNMLLPVYGRAEAGQRLVNARELHTVLGVGKKFTDWVKERIGKHRFVHNTDYVMLQPDKTIFPNSGKNKSEETRGRKRTEYAFTLDAAKMVAMGTNNEVGDQIKRYFLYCEKLALNSGDYHIVPRTTCQQWLPGLEEHLAPKFQREQAQRLQKLLRERAGINAVIRHGRGACLSQTGLGAREIIQLGQAVGLPAKHRTNAREVLRHMAPAVACSMSLYDALASFGYDAEGAGKVAAKAQEVFHDMLQLGAYPLELVPFTRFVSGTTIYY